MLHVNVLIQSHTFERHLVGKRANSLWQKLPEYGTTGETACPTTKDQQFTMLVGQAVSPVGTSSTGC